MTTSDLLMITLGGSRHRTRRNHIGCVGFWHSNALIQTMLDENGFWHYLASQYHLRSFISRSFAGPQGVGYRISEVFEDVANYIAEYSRLRPPHPLTWRPRQEEPPQIPPWTLYFQKLESLDYILVAGCMGLSLFTFVQWALKDSSLPQKVHFCRSRSFKVAQGRWFWYQSKAHIRLSISD